MGIFERIGKVVGIEPVERPDVSAFVGGEGKVKLGKMGWKARGDRRCP